MKQPLKRSVVEKAAKQSLAFIAATCLLAGCGDSDKDPGVAGGSVEDQEIIAEEIIPIENKTISGVSQKGPFVNGSSVTVQELEGKTLAQTGRSYEGKIKNDRGEFSVNVVNLESQFALLKANGFYRNEVTGEQSKSQVTLYALTDLSDRDEVNVNLLTHLEYERSLNLATSEGMTVAKAKKQAEKEIFATFGIDGDFESSEDLNIFGSGDGSAALLAISTLMQGDLKEADFSKRLADYATDIETDGKWDDEKAKTSIADWAAKTSLKGGLAGIRKNIEGWELSDKVSAFEKFVDNFWWENYELGACNSKREGEIQKNGNLESELKDMKFICLDGAWMEATDFAKDTHSWKAGNEGDIKKGDTTGTVYVFENDGWRVADKTEAVLGGCVKATADSVGKADSSWYICREGEWAKAKQIEYDTYRWEAGEDGDAKHGDVNSNACYVYDGEAWREGNDLDCSLGLGGCTKARLDEKKQAESEEWYVCTDISGTGDYSWKIKYAPAGTCMPSKNSVYKGETVTWTFVVTNPASASTTELAEYNELVKNSTCEWTMTGSDPASASGKCGSDGKTATATYTEIGSHTADLKIGENTISCGSVQVVPAPLTGCKCEASETTPDVGMGDVTVTWTVNGCHALADITSYTWAGITGDGDTATMTFTEKGQTASPSVQVTDSENQLVNLACPAVSSVNSNAPEYVDP